MRNVEVAEYSLANATIHAQYIHPDEREHELPAEEGSERDEVDDRNSLLLYSGNRESRKSRW